MNSVKKTSVYRTNINSMSLFINKSHFKNNFPKTKIRKLIYWDIQKACPIMVDTFALDWVRLFDKDDMYYMQAENFYIDI